MYDLIIHNGTIVDGTATPRRRGSVAVEGDRIVAIGDVSGDARAVIEARGLTVAPGFIDVHSHDDAAVVREPRVDFKIMQGVTTDIVGNCGAGVAPASDAFRDYYERGFGSILGASGLPWRTTADYFAAVDAAGPACNVAAYVPHGVVRYNAMGLERREPNTGELALMRELVEEGMSAGAIGMSTGLIYPPGSYSRTEELIELANVVAKHGGIYTSHIRNEGDRLLEAMDEAIAVGEQSGCPVQLSHHKSAGAENFGGTAKSLPKIDEARSRGLDVTMDVYPYVAGSSSLAAMWRVGRERLFEEVPGIIASVKHNKELYEGKYISAIAGELDLPIGDTVQKILRDEENTPSVILFHMDEPDVRRVLAHPQAMIGSDGLPTDGKPHPRLYGTMARVLGEYVRDLGLLTIEEAVRKMTSLPANKHRLEERGQLREGWHADIVVFDPATIADVATYEEPRRYPAGIAHVIVNGRVAVRDGRQTDGRAGRMLRRASQ